MVYSVLSCGTRPTLKMSSVKLCRLRETKNQIRFLTYLGFLNLSTGREIGISTGRIQKKKRVNEAGTQVSGTGSLFEIQHNPKD